VIAVLTVAGGATAVALRLGSSTAAPAVPTFAPLPAPKPAPVPASIPASISAQVSASLSQTSVEPAAAAPADLLRRQLDGDAARVESLVGKWVPQLSSKREGDVVDGTRFDAAAVWADFQSWQQKVPSSVLTRSERFTSFRGKDYWVTLAAEPFGTAEAANAWCVTQQLAPSDCFAKRLSHTDGPGGNTRPR
jgi:serine/threonine-protein kinase